MVQLKRMFCQCVSSQCGECMNSKTMATTGAPFVHVLAIMTPAQEKSKHQAAATAQNMAALTYLFEAFREKLPQAICIQAHVQDLAIYEIYWLAKPLAKPFGIQEDGEFGSGLEKGFYAVQVCFYVLKSIGERAHVYTLGDEVHVMALSTCVRHTGLKFMCSTGGEFLFSNTLHKMLLHVGNSKDQSYASGPQNLRTQRKRRSKK